MNEKVKQAFLHDFFILGGLFPKAKSVRREQHYNLMYGDYSTVHNLGTIASEICKAIKDRKVDYKLFEKLDKEAENINYLKFLSDLGYYNSENTNYLTRLSDEGTTWQKVVAEFCAKNNIKFKLGAVSKYELEEIVKHTEFGKALYEADAYTLSKDEIAEMIGDESNSQAQTAQQATTTAAQNNNNQNTANQATTPGSANQKKGYKYSGPQASKVPNLISQQKVTLSSPVFCIEADKVGKNVPNLFITPVKYDSARDVVYAPSKTAAEQVKFSSGNFYTDCKLWFNSVADADAALVKAKDDFGHKFTNMHVAKGKADASGYFYVSTEYGPAYIKAQRLNEMLENLQESCQVDKSSKKQKTKLTNAYKVDFDSIDEFTETLMRETI